MADNKILIKHVRSGLQKEVSVKEWETIQSNSIVAKSYVFVSQQPQKPTKTSTEESK
ncbi:hypothetical protein [Sphingobacterium multivorum]|uniref:hypothetical protein n=1 Tax=Sphingobacterium multivorum TaxID=28454 RepID=UPI0031BA4EC8